MLDVSSENRLAALDTTVAIETPEHVRFCHEVVGPSRRAFAWGIDIVIRALLVGLLMLVASVLGWAGGFGSLETSAGIAALIAFAAEWFYFATFEALWSGRTPGKRVLGIRVVRDNGQPIDAHAAVLRNLLRAVDFLPGFYAIANIVMVRDARFRRLGDLAASTMVVVESRKQLAMTYQLSPPPSFQELAWVRSLPRLEAEDIKTIDLLVRRGATLHPRRVHELAAMLAPVFANQLGATYHEPIRFIALLHHRSRLPRSMR